MLKILIASLVGALICVTWGAVSWMVLQWHDSAVRGFADEAAVARVIAPNAAEGLKSRGGPSGVFMLPRISMEASHAPREEAAGRLQASRLALESGPFVFAIVRPGPHTVNMGLNIAYAFGRSFAACFIIALMLGWTMRLDYIQRVFYCVLGGLFAGAVTDLPMMIWFEAPLRYTLINLADHLCEWFAAGLAIAAFVPGRDVWETVR